MEFGVIELATFIVGLTAALGGASRWLISRMDRMHERDQKFDQTARDKLEAAFAEKMERMEAGFGAEMKAMRETIAAQKDEVRFLQAELHRYIKHVGILEGVLKSHKIDIPAIEAPVLGPRR